MATVKQYALQLWDTHKTVSRKLGQSVEWGSSEGRVAALGTDVMLAGLIKVLTDAGVITNAQLTQVYNAIANADFPPLPAMVPGPVDGETLPDPDLGG